MVTRNRGGNKRICKEDQMSRDAIIAQKNGGNITGEEPHSSSTATQSSPHEVVLGIALSYLASWSLHVANELGIADLLKDGPKSIEELAQATGAHQQSLYR